MVRIDWILAKRIFLLNGLLSIGTAIIAQPVSKPTTIAQAPAATGTIATGPSDYTTGIKINYIRTWDAMGAYQDPNAMVGAGYLHAKEATQYLDGLGRPLQTVSRQASPGTSPKDLIAPVVYDEFGREIFKYLPFVQNAGATNNGAFKMNAFTDQDNFYKNVYKDATDQIMYAGEQALYSRIEFEGSPLNRVLKSFAPGNSWAGSYNPSNPSTEKATNQKYLVNTSTEDNVRIWDIANDLLTYTNNDVATNIPISRTDPYSAGELYKNVTIDEHGNAVVEYKDKEDKVILKKVQTGSIASDYSGYTNFLCTYYIYDDLNQLRFVIPPKAVDAIKTNWAFDNDIINELCFRYEYDERQRMIAKKVPGAGWVCMVYDQRDRMVYSQDANLSNSNKWLVTLYDELNRPTITGMITYTGNRNTLQAYVNGQTITASPIPVVAGTTTTANLIFTVREPGRTIYHATSRIRFEPGFTTEPGGNFTARIVPISFSENITVTGSPLPPDHNFIALTITYYDNYSWTNKTYSTAYNDKLDEGVNPHMEAPPTQTSTNLRGMMTGTKIRVLGNPADLTSGAFMTSVNFYDEKNRVIQTQAENYKGGTDTTTNLYDFTGKVLSSYLVHNNPGSPQVRVQTNVSYDHAGRLLETWKIINDNESKKALIAKNEYDDLGQLKRKELGRQKDANGAYTSEPLEKLDYTYNIRGWLKGINKYYANKHGTQETDRWFGLELNYDWGFDNNQFNGNIAGTKWRSKGDGEQRAYGFGYDKVNRLLAGDFSQRSGANYIDDGSIKFDMIMGDGIDPQSAYDANGNIKGMKQWGLKGLSSAVIDELTYGYVYQGNSYSNKLRSVSESAAISSTDNKLGDFTDINLSGDDYSYDANGNLVEDKNKKIREIRYTHLNLPYFISKQMLDKIATVGYLYDAVGNKLQKTVFPNDGGYKRPLQITEYISGFVYEGRGSSNGITNQAGALKFFAHEEGRVRYKPATATQPEKWVYDYFVKDHLGNVRVVLTEEQQTDAYPAASMETTKTATEEALYSNLNTTRTDKPAGYPTDTYTNPNDKVARVKAEAGSQKIGPAIVLKVMAGDKFNIRANSWYKTNNEDIAYPIDPLFALNDLVSALAGSIGSITSTHGGASASELTNSGVLIPGATTYLNSHTASMSKPKAYLNWVLFDNQFKIVSGNSGFEQVGNDEEFKTHTQTGLPIDKSGYLYVYVSNETPNIDVFFDNLQATHIRGPLLEETHYYPFGLEQAGISSKALAFGDPENKRKYNGIEKENELQIDVYDAQLRELDGQIGRWWEIDPKVDNMEMWSPYVSNYDNPIRYTDPLGDEGQDCCWDKVKQAWNWASDRFMTSVHNETKWVKSTWNQAGKNFDNRWAARADPLHQFIDNPFSMIEGPAAVVSVR